MVNIAKKLPQIYSKLLPLTVTIMSLAGFLFKNKIEYMLLKFHLL